jgi:hypothetical protein
VKDEFVFCRLQKYYKLLHYAHFSVLLQSLLHVTSRLFLIMSLVSYIFISTDTRSAYIRSLILETKCHTHTEK